MSIKHLPPWSKVVCNAAAFQAGWFSCVYFSSSYWIVLATLLIVLLINHVAEAFSRREILLIALAACLGSVMDMLLGIVGVFQFGSGVLLPMWLLSLWVLFATLLPRSLHWMSKYKWIGALCGFVAAPFSYWFGAGMTGVSLGFSIQVSLIVIGVCWAVLFPCLLWLTQAVLSEEANRVVASA